MYQFKNFALMLFIALTAMGCASLGTYNPATGRNEVVLLSTAQEVNMGQSTHQQLLREYEFSHNIHKNEKLQRLGWPLAAVSDRKDYQYNFYLIENESLNAFTTPGGNIYFYTGLFDKLTDEQIAGVLAHEIAHGAAKHVAKKFQTSLGYSVVRDLLLNAIEPGRTQTLVSHGAGITSSLLFSAYSRQDEYEADRLALRYMQRAGYDPQGMVDALKVLQEHSEGGGGVPLFLRTHPHIEDRIEVLQQLINQGNY